MKYAAHPLQSKLPSMLPDKPINHFGFFEKMATAFFKQTIHALVENSLPLQLFAFATHDQRKLAHQAVSALNAIWLALFDVQRYSRQVQRWITFIRAFFM